MKKIKYIIGIIAIFITDQISKIIVSNYLELNESIIVIKNFFRLTYTHNNGAAFGMFGGKTILILLITFLVLAYLLYELFKNKNSSLKIDLGIVLIIGGLLGNLLDRLVFGYVRDFLDFNFGSYDFAIFNVGDAFIVIGTIIFMIGVVLEEKYANKSNN